MVTALDMIEHDKVLKEYWVKRVFAAIIDGILVLAPVYVFLGLIEVIGGRYVVDGGLAAGFVWFGYSAAFEIALGATIGKMLVGMKIASTSRNLGARQIIVRNVTKVFALLMILDVLLGFLTETTDPRQRYVDRIAGTVPVVVD